MGTKSKTNTGNKAARDSAKAAAAGTTPAVAGNGDKKVETDEAEAAGGHPGLARAASDAAEEAAGAKPAEKKPAETPVAAPATPKVSDALVKAGRALLEGNPSLREVYMTTDGVGFAEKNDADNHARALKNKAVVPVKREDNAKD